MKRLVVLGMLGMAGVVGACGSGAQGPTGQAGPAGSNGMDGANGEAGPPGSGSANPSVSGVTPPKTFLARTVDVSISGYGTSWSSTTKVDFGGADIAVNKITVASPTALVVNISTSSSAALGPRNVTVTDGANTETFKDAFEVLSPVSWTFQGTLAQGTLLLATATVLDITTPLDTTQVPDPSNPFGTIPGNVAVTGPAGVTASAISATDFGATFELFVDVPTAAGMADLTLVSGPPGAMTNVSFPAPKSLNLAARTPTALTSGTATTGTTATIYATSLYSFTAPSASLSIVDFSVSTTSSTATPALIVLPSDGKWADQVAAGQASAGPASFTILSTTATPYYGVTFDGSGATGPYSVSATSVAPGATAATTATDGTKGTAIVATKVPFVLTGGDLSQGTGNDWVKVTTTTAMTDIHVQTVGDPLTDVAVTVYAADGTTVVGTPADPGTNVDTTFPTTTAGVYYVAFSQGAYYAAPDTTYQAIIRVP